MVNISPRRHELSLFAAHLGENSGLLWERDIRPLHRRHQRRYGADTIEYISIYITYLLLLVTSGCCQGIVQAPEVQP
jgi:hypothetical protein